MLRITEDLIGKVVDYSTLQRKYPGRLVILDDIESNEDNTVILKAKLLHVFDEEEFKRGIGTRMREVKRVHSNAKVKNIEENF